MRNTRQLDHYIGRKVLSVKGKQGDWQINLEGDVSIVNTCDPNTVAANIPTVEPGWTFLKFDDYYGILFFGLSDGSETKVEVPIDLNNYTLHEPSLSDMAFRPADLFEFDPETPPEPEDRIAEGPLLPPVTLPEPDEVDPDLVRSPEPDYAPVPSKRGKVKRDSS